MKKIGVLFVCMGNICRSPAGEAILKKMVGSQGNYLIQSCGIGPWHVGELPDARMRKCAFSYGIELSSIAQQFSFGMWEEFDYILAADISVLRYLQERSPENFRQKLYLMNDFNPGYEGTDVPDPYWAGEEGFHVVFKMLERVCEGLIQVIKEKEKNESLM